MKKGDKVRCLFNDWTNIPEGVLCPKKDKIYTIKVATIIAGLQIISLEELEAGNHGWWAIGFELINGNSNNGERAPKELSESNSSIREHNQQKYLYMQ